jgi:uncharacterized protein (DUF433 family)
MLPDKFVEIDANGMPFLAGTRFKLPELITAHIAYRWYPEQLQIQYPQLTLAQIYGAFAYYYDHKEEIDGLIAERERKAEEAFAQLGDGPVTAKLRALKKATS